MTEPRFAFATETRDKINNQDAGCGERILMADGAFAYVACIADGVSTCDSPREVAALAVSAFRRAMEAAKVEVLLSDVLRAVWLDQWSRQLVCDVKTRVSYGLSTFCAVALFPLPASGQVGENGWGLLSINVGDSCSYLVSGLSNGCTSLHPPEPKDRPNIVGGNPARVVGLDGSPLFDCSLTKYPPGFSGYFWVGSVGVFKDIPGSDLFDLSRNSGVPFRKLPDVLLDCSWAEGRKAQRRKLDNASVALLGLNVPEDGDRAMAALSPYAVELRERRAKARRRKNLNLIFFFSFVLVFVVLISLLLSAYLKSHGEVTNSPDEPPLNNDTVVVPNLGPVKVPETDGKFPPGLNEMTPEAEQQDAPGVEPPPSPVVPPAEKEEPSSGKAKDLFEGISINS